MLSPSTIRMMFPRLARFAIVGTLLASVASAQPAPPPPPLPPEPASTSQVPPPFTSDPELEPQVTIIRREGETHEEVRMGGELKFIRVTPLHGRPYFLVPDQAGRQFIRRESLDPSLKVPLWVLFSW